MPDFSSYGSSTIGDAMLGAAKEANRLNAGSLSHKIATKLKYTGRKQLIHAPQNVGLAALGKIPFAGALISFGADWAVKKYSASLAEKKQANYKNAVNQGGNDLEDLRKQAKWDAKSLKDLCEKLDGNQVKLKHATEAFAKAYQHFCSNSSNDAAIDGVLMAAAEQERYINKISLMLIAIAGATEHVQTYIDEALVAALKAQSELVGTLNNLADAKGTGHGALPVTKGPPLPPRPGMGPPPIPPRPGVVLNRPGGPPVPPPRPKWP